MQDAVHRAPSDMSGDGEPALAGGAILVVAACLMAIGGLMVGSSHASLDRALLDGTMWRTPFGRQVIFIAAGFLVMVAVARHGPALLGSEKWLPRLVVGLFVLAAIALVFPFVQGLSDLHGGQHRWLRASIGGVDIGFQPSEIAKLATVAFLAFVLTRPTSNPTSFWLGFAPAAMVLGAIVALVGTEDFGTCALIAAAGGLLLLVAGCRFLHLSLIVALGSAGMAGLLLIAPYRMERITAFWNILETAQEGGYQPLQSLITIASGGWLGRGLGEGVQKYGYLPESHTDFIFAVVCEELGVAGAAGVIVLFCVVTWLGLRAMQRAATPFEALLAFGIAAMIAVQAFLNIAVVTVLTPTTGISLPLISAGGSGLLTNACALGLLAAIERRATRREASGQPQDERDDTSACLLREASAC